jgi:hypothetical protein
VVNLWFSSSQIKADIAIILKFFSKVYCIIDFAGLLQSQVSKREEVEEKPSGLCLRSLTSQEINRKA